MASRRRPIGRILLERGIVTEEQLKEALQLHREQGVRTGEALQQLGYCSDADIAAALAEQFGLELVDPVKMDIPADALDAVPKAMAQEHHIIPIARSNGRLKIAMADPLDLYALDNLRFATNSDIDCVIASRTSIEQAIAKKYGIDEETVDNMLQEFTESDIQYVEGQTTGEIENADAESAPIIKLVHLIITEALRSRASDIHVEPMADRLRIRYRVDGICFDVESPPKRLQGAILSRIKIMAGIDIAEKRRPTDGRIRIKLLGRDIDIRVSCIPAMYGESICMRLLDKQKLLLGIQDLGFLDDDYQRFLNIIRRPNGIFLVTGPTGSGKTTTLYAALSELNTPNRKIITVENPVEYNIPGINQAEVLEAIGRTFARILRAMLRQAPNIILVGEIRDQETAEIAIQAALTGHLVFSTLHTNDAPSAITRLIDMGIAPFLVATSVQAIMAQRLVRTICPNCKQPHQYSQAELEAVGISEADAAGVTFYKGAGCPECKGTGYKGRLAIFELLQMTPEIRDLAFRKAPLSQIREQAAISGMRTLVGDGIRKVIMGITTIEEVVRVAKVMAAEAAVGM